LHTATMTADAQRRVSAAAEGRRLHAGVRWRDVIARIFS
jgi:hypothetical protein